MKLFKTIYYQNYLFKTNNMEIVKCQEMFLRELPSAQLINGMRFIASYTAIVLWLVELAMHYLSILAA